MQDLVKNRVDQEEVENERTGRGLEWNENIHGPRGISGWRIVAFIGMLVSMFLVAKKLFSKTLPALFSDSEITRFETMFFREIYDAEWTTILMMLCLRGRSSSIAVMCSDRAAFNDDFI